MTGAPRAPRGRARTKTSRQVLSLYDAAPAAVRAHVRVRWATCPFRAVAAQLPPAGRVLELGCGHGLFSVLAALSSPGRSVVGVDVDERKVHHGRVAAGRARERGAACEITTSPPGEVPDGPWDAIVVVDVLYLLDEATQRDLLRTCARHLAPGGRLAVKEMAPTPAWKARWNLVQETIAVRVMGITAGGSGFRFVGPSALEEWMVEDGLAVRQLPLHRGYPHPHHLVLGARPS